MDVGRRLRELDLWVRGGTEAADDQDATVVEVVLVGFTQKREAEVPFVRFA